MKPVSSMSGVLRAVGFPYLVAACACACAPVAPQSAEEICGGRLAGDLVVTEFMADPQDSDTGKQYIELYNITSADIELDGLSLFQSLSDGSREKATVLSGAKVPGRSYFVLGDIAANAVSKPSYVDYGYATRLGALRHVAGRLGVRCGTKLIDSVSYQNTISGHARALDGAQPPDSAQSALDQNWCNESQPLTVLPPAGENFGTPGAANSVCANLTAAGTCVDPMLGEARAIQSPALGDLVISEVMAAPAAVSQAAGEWFELYARKGVDLNGFTVRSRYDRAPAWLSFPVRRACMSPRVATRSWLETRIRNSMLACRRPRSLWASCCVTTRLSWPSRAATRRSTRSIGRPPRRASRGNFRAAR